MGVVGCGGVMVGREGFLFRVGLISSKASRRYDLNVGLELELELVLKVSDTSLFKDPSLNLLRMVDGFMVGIFKWINW